MLMLQISRFYFPRILRITLFAIHASFSFYILYNFRTLLVPVKLYYQKRRELPRRSFCLPCIWDLLLILDIDTFYLLVVGFIAFVPFQIWSRALSSPSISILIFFL